MIQSMSRVGCSLDNAPTEGFWGIIKSEMYYNFKFENEDELRRTIKDYIFFYNNNWSYVNILDTKSQTFLCCTSS